MSHMSSIRAIFLLGSFLGMAIDARAIIFYSAGNEHNTTDPGDGLPWQNVVEVRSSSGITGSGVYLGNRYVLTAAHVGPTDFVRVNNSLDFSLEPAEPLQFATPGMNPDLKLLRLQTNPGLGNVLLNTASANDLGAARLVGNGVGRSGASPTGTSPVPWGDASTANKRWGENVVDNRIFNQTPSGSAYTSDLLRTQFNTNAGVNEAALTLYDSGSALFRFVESNWLLVGLGAYVASNGESYANPTALSGSQSNDDNYFIRISSYATAENVLGGIVVPEPAALHRLVWAAGIYILSRRKAG